MTMGDKDDGILGRGAQQELFVQSGAVAAGGRTRTDIGIEDTHSQAAAALRVLIKVASTQGPIHVGHIVTHKDHDLALQRGAQRGWQRGSVKGMVNLGPVEGIGSIADPSCRFMYGGKRNGS